ncbi:MAG: LCP family protein [Solirubrobacteraceae bacterium]|nr:LCP family protein [Solirubrobacteraceae bacterium]
MSGKRNRYRRYRGGSPGQHGRPEDPLQELRDLRRAESGKPLPPRSTEPWAQQPSETPGRSGLRRPAREQRAPSQPSERPSLAPRRAVRPAKTLGRRVLKWVFVWAVAWSALSLVVFLVSAQLHQADVGDGAALLGGGATPPLGESTILVIGSDTRTKDSQEPGATKGGYGLADSIMLLRVGGGSGAKLSIARDTLVPVEGYGVVKINSAYAYGGPALLTKTVEDYTGIDVNHVMQIGFDSFPPLIDAMGGITYRGSCVISKINGGYANGGITLRIKTGEKVTLNGKQALALARTRKNSCNPKENDLTRARRQQKVLSSMKRRALSPIGFVRLPLIAWAAPKTMDSDMAGPRLLGTMAGMVFSGGGKTRVLGTETGYVPDELKAREVERFLSGG